MTEQETFDIVVNHLRQQGCKSQEEKLDPLSDLPRCMYRGPNGTKCAAGILIPDEDYRVEMEGWFVANYRIKAVLEKYGHSEILVARLQHIHDNFAVCEWENKFKDLAKLHQLEYHEPTAA